MHPINQRLIHRDMESRPGMTSFVFSSHSLTNTMEAVSTCQPKKNQIRESTA